MRPLLPVGAQAQRGGGYVRGMGHESVRQAALRRILPFLHREGVGYPRFRDPLALGGSTDQELLSRQGGPLSPWFATAERDDADRGDSLPTTPPRPDVGGVHGVRRRQGRWRAPQSPLCRVETY